MAVATSADRLLTGAAQSADLVCIAQRCVAYVGTIGVQHLDEVAKRGYVTDEEESRPACATSRPGCSDPAAMRCSRSMSRRLRYGC